MEAEEKHPPVVSDRGLFVSEPLRVMKRSNNCNFHLSERPHNFLGHPMSQAFKDPK